MNGIFVVVFSSNVGGVGWGLAVIENNRIHGGDLGFLYRGSIAAGQGAENIEANLEVKKYNKDAMSVFGPLSDFKLSLRGKIDQQSGGV